MVTFTTLAESKCQLLLSRHTSPIPGSSTSTATAETRPCRAAWIARVSLAASAPWEDERQTGDDPAAPRPAAASAGRARNAINATAGRAAATTPVSPRLGFTKIPSRTPKIAPLPAGPAATR